ncbi:AAA family ATPase [uncultured Brachyspira sp.]|uniref:AAA family ATPase n=1 Tax=uncultured Brachyspira sp. TaxID=221953 RepID=UPI002584C78D|nr:AAA family ATPase [uncultured Brachyspira sp.]
MSKFPIRISTKKLQIQEVDMSTPRVKNGEKSNFILIYGKNGIGKTTLSECLRIPDMNKNKYDIKQINLNEWENLNFCVYNKHFVNENIFSYDTVKPITGLFNIIIGNKLINQFNELNKTIEEVKEYKELVTVSNANIKTKEAELNGKMETLIKNIGENYKNKIDLNDDDIIKRINELNEKIPKSLSEEDYQRLDTYIEDIDNIVDIDKIIYAINYQFNILNPEEEKSIFNFVEFIETGKEWYKIGLKAIEHTNNICPFCKQELSKVSINLINNYKKYIFDNSQKELEKMISDNINMIDRIMDLIKRNNDISNNKKMNNNFKIDANIEKELKLKIDILKNNLKNKLNALEFKPDIDIENFKKAILNYSQYIKQKNKDINSYNSYIYYKMNERELALKNEENINKEIGYYQYLKNNRDDVNNLLKEIKELEDLISKSKEEYEKSQNHYVNITNEMKKLSANYETLSKDEINKYSDKINDILKKFDIGFQIETNLNINTKRNNIDSIGDINAQYKIKRLNNEDVDGKLLNYSLSESEKNILGISFFLAQLPENSKENSIIVFDDPMSSFDISRSSEIAKYITNDMKEFKYIIILTHNIEFASKLYYRTSGKIFCLELYEYNARVKLKNSDEFIGIDKLIEAFLYLLRAKEREDYFSMKNCERAILDIILSNAYLCNIDNSEDLKEYYRLISLGKSMEDGRKFSFFRNLKNKGILAELVDLYDGLSTDLHLSNSDCILSDSNEELPRIVNNGFETIRKYFIS